MREIQRRADDLRDTERFLLVSQMTPRFALYYNVIDDVYVMNDPKGGTLFKRRKAAVAVRAFLGKSVRILRCQSKRIKGVRVPVLNSQGFGTRGIRRSWSKLRGLPNPARAVRSGGRSRR